MTDNKDIIIGEISNAISKLLGSSAAAVMRTAGAATSHRLWPELPAGVSVEEAGRVMHDGVQQLGGFGDFRITGETDEVVSVEFKGCFFATMRATSGRACGEQSICYFGFGLMEETFKRLTGRTVKVEFARREEASDTCFELLRPRAGAHG